MTSNQISGDFLERIFSAFLKSCGDVVIIPLCENNISLLHERLISEHKHIPSTHELMTRLTNLRMRSKNLLTTHEDRDSFCSFALFPFDNYIAATILKDWDKFDKAEGDAKTKAKALLSADSTDAQLTRKNSEPVIALEDEPSLDQPTVNEGDHNYSNDDSLVLVSLGVRDEGDPVPRNLLSTLRRVVRNDMVATAQSTHITGLYRSGSFDLIHETRSVLHERKVVVHYGERVAVNMFSQQQ